MDSTVTVAARWWHGFPLAIQFLTVLPVRVPANLPERGMAISLAWFPLVGCLLGGLVALSDWLLAFLLPLPIRDVFVVTLLAILTGMLHLDGFLDCCDGLLGHHTTARRLAIMRDSRVGAYGVIGGILLVLLQVTALAALPSHWRSMSIISGVLLGRWAMVGAVTWFPYARATGAGAGFRASTRVWAIATIVMVLLLILLASLQAAWGSVGWGRANVTFGSTALVAGICWWGGAWGLSRRLTGGLTGDTYGAINELTTLAVWLSLPITLTMLR